MSFEDYQSDVVFPIPAGEVAELIKIREERERALEWMRQAGVVAADIQAQNKKFQARREHLMDRPFAHLDGLIRAALDNDAS